MANEQVFDFLLALDFEGLGHPEEEKAGDLQDIIDWVVVAIDLKTLDTSRVFHAFIKPFANSDEPGTDSPTGRSANNVGSEISFAQAFQAHIDWLATNNFLEGPRGVRWAYLAGDDWAMGTCLPSLCRHYKLLRTEGMRRWMNLESLYQKWKGLDIAGLGQKLSALGLSPPSQTQSCSERCKTMAQVAVSLVKAGCVIGHEDLHHSSPLPTGFALEPWQCPTAMCDQTNNPYSTACCNCDYPRHGKRHMVLMEDFRAKRPDNY